MLTVLSSQVCSSVIIVFYHIKFNPFLSPYSLTQTHRKCIHAFLPDNDSLKNNVTPTPKPHHWMTCTQLLISITIYKTTVSQYWPCHPACWPACHVRGRNWARHPLFPVRLCRRCFDREEAGMPRAAQSAPVGSVGWAQSPPDSKGKKTPGKLTYCSLYLTGPWRAKAH